MVHSTPTIALAMTLITLALSDAQAQTPWEWRHPLPQGSHVNDVIWDGSRFVGVGDRQAVVASGDGITWARLGSPASPYQEGVAFNGTRYVAVGATVGGQPVIYSNDAVTWTRSTFSTSALESVIWTGTQFVAVGVSGATAASADGITWTPSSAGTSTLYDVAFNGAQYIAVGSGGVIFTSSNGTSWAAQTSGTSNSLRGAAWAATQWVVVGDSGTVRTSPDGVTWSAQVSGTSNQLLGVGWTGSRIIAVGNSGKIVTSTDGSTWTASAAVTSNKLRQVRNGGGTVVATGDYGSLLSSSDDGLTWTKRLNSISESNLNGLAVSPFGITAVGAGGTILGSPNGVNWAVRTSGTTTQLNKVVWTGARYVAVGSSGLIRTSNDGISWTAATSGTTQSLNDVGLYGGGVMAVGGNGTILTSPDGITWTPRTSGVAVQLNGVTWTGTEAVVVGHGTTLLRSADGITWTPTSPPVAAGNIYAVTWTGTKVLAVGDADRAVSSPDFTTWTTGTLNLLSGNARAVIWLGTKAVVCGWFGSYAVSTDLITWSRPGGLSEPTGNELRDMAVFGQDVIVAGNGGTILTNAFDGALPPPEIVVEQPAANSLTDGVSSVAFDAIAIGSGGVTKTVTISNTGSTHLTSLTVTKDGADSAQFSTSTSTMAVVLWPGESTTFTVTFASVGGASGTRNAALHISSNDADENPFDIALTGQAFSTTLDVDSDGMNDWGEYQLAALGFDWQVSNTAQVNTYFAAANSNGLYTTTQVQALNVGTPLIQRNPTTGVFTLTIGVDKSTNLSTWNPFPFVSPQTTINGQGEIEFQFTVPDNAAFFQLRAE